MRYNTNFLYGRIALPKGYCERCDTEAFVIDRQLRCCNAPYEGTSTSTKRVCDPRGRKVPSKKEQECILAAQDDKCYYCGLYFGSCVMRGIREIALKINWDHLSPYSYQRDNSTDNFVAACHICNGIKSNMIFQTQEEAQIYILEQRRKKGYE